MSGGAGRGQSARRPLQGSPPPDPPPACAKHRTAGLAPHRPTILSRPNSNPPSLPQVVDAKVVVDKPARGPLKPQKVAECTVGDASGVVLLTARNEQGATARGCGRGLMARRQAPWLLRDTMPHARHAVAAAALGSGRV